MIAFFQFFTQKLRLSNPWRYKVPLLISFTYFMLLVGSVSPFDASMSFFAAISTTIGFMGFGYVTNDLADRKKDALAGKPNSVTNLSLVQRVVLIALFLALAIGPWLYLPLDRISTVLIIAELALFVLYAFPPFRLKEKGFLGVVTDALYAHALPGFLASWTFFLVGNEDYPDFFYFALTLTGWQLFSGIRNIVSHQLKDLDNDLASGTHTFATRHGKQKVARWFSRLFIPLEVVAFFPFLFFIQLEIEFLCIALLIFLVSAYGNWKQNASNEPPAKNFTNAFLDRFYIHWFPYIVLLDLAFGRVSLWWLTVFHVFLFHPAVGRLIKRISFRGGSAAEAENLSAQSKKVAILSTNRNQYSETFIHAHMRSIANAVVYSDGYFPTSISLDNGKTWKKLSDQKATESDLIQSWREQKVEVVLAEYGPAGVEVMSACKKANLPLVVHFHGFDAYRNDVLAHYGERYVELFKMASAIVVVSKDMEMQLRHLGCPVEKLKRIPYGVNTEHFSPNTEIQTRENFIACGRFVAKKAPLNTIQAFRKVVDAFPDAKLTFIGDGDLLEDAKMCALHLGLANNIDFKGVLTPSEVARELQKHAIFVQHSMRTDENDSEGTPLAILEAAATGLAIVATKHGGIVEVIEDGESGFLVDEGDVKAMSLRMIECLKFPEKARNMGAAARGKVISGFRQDKYNDALKNVLEKAECPPQKHVENRWRVWKYRAIIFFSLVILAEIGLRIVGYKPGVIEAFYFHKHQLEYDSLMYADETGISHIVPGSEIILNGRINQEGFFSEVEYNRSAMDELRSSGKKIVMLIGDSYTQGCCANEYGESFASLINQSEEYEVLNFGIPGADPLQYRLIAEKYIPIIQPDLVLVVIYGGNDIMEYDRTPKPFVPLAYPVKNGPWLNSEGPIYLTKQGTYFKNFNEAKQHYFQFFSLWSDQSSFFEKLIRPSVLLSRPYMKWKTRKRYELIKDQMPVTIKEPPYSRQNLMRIQALTQQEKIQLMVTLIPSPSDVAENTNLRKKYGFLFGEIEWLHPPQFSPEDYDGNSDGNHFNSVGHQKYAVFLKKVLMKQFEK